MFIKELNKCTLISSAVILKICLNDNNVYDIISEAGCDMTALSKGIEKDINNDRVAVSGLKKIPAFSRKVITFEAKYLIAGFSAVANYNDIKMEDITPIDVLYFLLLKDQVEPVDALSWIEETGGNVSKVFDNLLEKFPVGPIRHFDAPSGLEHLLEEIERANPNASDKKEFDVSKYPCLVDMLEEAKNTSIPIIGREDVLDRTIQILNRKTKHNVFHLGEPGVGKTACTIGLAKKILNGDVPECLKSARVYSLDVGTLMSGTKYRGDLEERLVNTLKALSSIPDSVVLYIDEVHMLMGAGAGGDSSCDIANLLKPYLSNPDSKLRVIGSTTLEEYRKKVEPDKAFCRRFQTINVEEPTQEEAVKMLKGMKGAFESYHHVEYTEDAIESAVSLSAKYITDRFLPDKAIDLIDEAGSRAAIQGTGKVGKAQIQEVVAKIARIPDENITETETDKLRKLSSELKANVYGQDSAIDSIVRAIQLNKAGLTEDNKPVAQLLFVGPTGVGKTEVAKTVAKVLDIPFLRYDMSEYKDSTSVNKLVGSSAGYVGYEDGGLLVNDIKNNPYAVLLLDEIEKANPAVFDLLLQVFDNATLTDNKGRVADFRNVIIMMTSNAGAAAIQKRGVGFNSSEVNTSAMDSAVKDTFAPEFRNRLTATIKFNGMDRTMARSIAEKQLKILSSKLALKNVKMKYNDDVIDLIVEHSKAMEMGGREVLRTVENEIKPLFVEEILFGKLQNGGSATVSVKDNAFAVVARANKVKATVGI